MKRIILLVVIALCSVLTILICVNIRSHYKTNDIKSEMLNRFTILSQQTDTVTAAEATPFIWDEEYAYGGYSTPEKFEDLMGEREATYIETLEFNHREIYFLKENMVFDTDVLGYYNWRLFSKTSLDERALFDPADWLDIIVGEEGSIYLYY